ncbi:MAG: MIP family channel protein [Anaerolineaceae bacterium]|nr:MIP family channel protein [Anaerolineaceae bacterium]
MWYELLAEFFGTFVLILLGDGVVANVGLAPRLAPGAYSWDTIAFGWAFAVVAGVYVAGGVTGAHINPAVTFALAIKRGFPWVKVIPYWIAQVVGAFVGALSVYLIYRDGLITAGMPNVWATSAGAVFNQPFWGAVATPTATAHYSMITAAIAELFGTATLLMGVLAAFDSKNVGLHDNLGFLLVGFIVLAIGLSLGGTSGYAINPARDLGPRILGALVGTQGLFTGLYWLIVPVIMPLIGGPIGAILYDVFITPGLNAKVAAAEKRPAPAAVPQGQFIPATGEKKNE